MNKITTNDIKKEKCNHPLKHFQAPCGCCIIGTPGMLSPIMKVFQEPTQQHLAQHLEWDNGIEHPWDEKEIMIPVPELVINEKLLVG